MFDMGFTEILLIAIIALLFIGPDKLPETLRTIARTFGKIKRTFDDAKSTINTELQLDELKQETLKYRAELEKTKSELSGFKNIAATEITEIQHEVTKGFEPKSLNDADDLLDEDDLEEENEVDILEEEKANFNNNIEQLAKEAKQHAKKGGFKNLENKDA